ncbi:MAG TPA: cbb3-type cytochrome c oxidase subunit I [Burkholderiales bacterium]|nr:cbb3-type cytochrome c oxidase subunit I [Burkholderiales bacterium]
MYRSQRLALKYFVAAMALFGVMVVAGLLSATYFVRDGFLLNVLDFSIAKILHIDTLIIWLLMGFIGAVYWFLPTELERETEGIKLAEVMFYVFCAAVLIVAALFVFVQVGPGTESTLWLINQGRKYVEAPRWAAIGITLVVLVFVYNVVGTALKAKKVTGIMAVLIVDLVPLFGLYLVAFPAVTNMSEDLYWWWWLVHLWVEATWEILIGCIMALALMQLLGTSRRIVETWLYVEVALVLGTGILGLGHHYFWIGTPSYWLAIGGFFSALEPLPLLGMVVHAVYDAGTHHMKTTNKPAFWWMMAEAFGNFLGGGMWGFMMTLPQINLFTHGTQWTVSHGHFAFWGAYACGVIAVVYIALQKSRALDEVNGRPWKWSFALLNVGLIGMVGALLVAGMAQAFYERAIGGSTLQAFIEGQSNAWFVQGINARLAFGFVFAAGYAVLIYDLLSLGRRSAAEDVAGKRLAGGRA